MKGRYHQRYGGTNIGIAPLTLLSKGVFYLLLWRKFTSWLVIMNNWLLAHALRYRNSWMLATLLVLSSSCAAPWPPPPGSAYGLIFRTSQLPVLRILLLWNGHKAGKLPPWDDLRIVSGAIILVLEAGSHMRHVGALCPSKGWAFLFFQKSFLVRFISFKSRFWNLFSSFQNLN